MLRLENAFHLVATETVSADEAFARLGWSRTHGHRLINAGVIPAYRVGKKLRRVPIQAIERILREREG